jgi:phosphate starvation-inducible membrane PsiE
MGLQNVLRPGSREFVVALNVVLALLFFVMLAVVYTELEDSYHVFVLLFLVVGLTVSINWFILEANNLQHTQAVEGSKHKQDPATRAKTD